MIGSDTICKHADGSELNSCLSYSIPSKEACEENCTNHPHCLGYIIKLGTNLCILLPSKDSCPVGFDLYVDSANKYAETMNDIVPGQFLAGNDCYGKISGNYTVHLNV